VKEGIRLAVLSGAISALAPSFGIPSAFAADTPGGAPSEPGTLEEVVVTAQFRAQDVQTTPLAITAVSAAMLEARGQTNVSDVANRAPSVTLTTSTNGSGGAQVVSVNIRGVGQPDFNLAVEPGVGIYVDDVYYGTMYGAMMDLLDLDRVEISRGPQGTLSGKDSEGGSMKMYSKQPSAKQDAYVEATVGSFNERRLRAGANFTIVPDNVFFRLTGLGQFQDGYVTRYDYQCATGHPADALNNIPSQVQGGPQGCKIGSEGGTNVIALRGILKFLIDESAQDSLTFDDTRDRSETAPTVLTHQGAWQGPNYNFLGPPGPNPAANFATPPGSYYNYSSYCALEASPNTYCAPALSALDAWGVANVFDLKFSHDLSLKLISSYRDISQNAAHSDGGGGITRILQWWIVDYKQHTEELRFNGSIGKNIDWTVGGYYFHESALQGGRINLDEVGDTSGIPFYVATDFLFNDPVKVHSEAGFAHVEFRPTEKFTITAGGRYTDDYKRYDFARSFAPGYTPGLIDTSIVATNGSTGTFEGSRSDWRVTLAYQATDELYTYAQAATGFKGGGVNPRPYYPEQVQPFSPETVTSYEVGLKSEWLDRRVRLNLAAYYNKVKDMQLTLSTCPQYVPPGAPPNCYLPANVGDATIKGVEAELEAHPVAGLLIDMSASYLNFHYDSVDPNTQVLLTDKPPFTPSEKIALGIQYETRLGGGTYGLLTPRIDYTYQSEQWAAARNFSNDRIGGYGVANFRLTYTNPSGDWRAAVFVTNLFDKYYALSISDNTPPQGPTDDFISILPAPPREWGLTVTKTF
jgi:iron complex outermembrane receptor protein